MLRVRLGVPRRSHAAANAPTIATKRNFFCGWVFLLLSSGSPHVRPMGRTCNAPNEIELTAIWVKLNGCQRAHVCRGRSISPRYRRLSPTACACVAPGLLALVAASAAAVLPDPPRPCAPALRCPPPPTPPPPPLCFAGSLRLRQVWLRAGQRPVPVPVLQAHRAHPVDSPQGCAQAAAHVRHHVPDRRL